jgi:hypothetical protein
LLHNTVKDNVGPGLQMTDGSAGFGHNVLLQNGTGGVLVIGGTAIDTNLCNGGPCF